MKKLTIVTVAVMLGFIASINVVLAQWSALGSGYAITSNYHGVDVPFGVPITVTAGTLDTRVSQVTFRWHRPDDSVAHEVTVPVFTNGTMGQWNNGTSVLIRYAIDTFTPDVLGDWGVQAFFQNSEGKLKAGLQNVIKIRATSFNVIPEVPFGTMVILLSMFGAFSLLALKKKSNISSRIPS